MKRVVFSIIVCFVLSACALDSSPQYAHVEPAYRQQTGYRSQMTNQQKVNQDCRNYYQNHQISKLEKDNKIDKCIKSRLIRS